jgi:hypothetical protein
MPAKAFRQARNGNRDCTSDWGYKMAALFVALATIYLGAFGPPFRWRGAALLLAAMTGAGVVATISAAREAQAAGLSFGITPGSVLFALIEQAIFAFSFYGLAALARWAHLGLTRNDTDPASAG